MSSKKCIQWFTNFLKVLAPAFFYEIESAIINGDNDDFKNIF